MGYFQNKTERKLSDLDKDREEIDRYGQEIQMIWNIALVIQTLLGIIGFAAGKIFFANRVEGQLLIGIGTGAVVMGLSVLLIRIALRKRKLSDKDKRSVIGMIERKAKRHKDCAQKAGHYTFYISIYVLAIAIIAVVVGGSDPLILRTLLAVASPQILLFMTLYLVGRIRDDD